jgi:hypothetical protein
MLNPSSELHLRSCIAVPLHATFFFLQRNLFLQRDRNFRESALPKFVSANTSLGLHMGENIAHPKSHVASKNGEVLKNGPEFLPSTDATGRSTNSAITARVSVVLGDPRI